jgi:hypothetical protein
MRHDHNRIRRSEYTHLPYTTRAAAVHASGDVIARRTRRYLSVQERVAVLTQSSAAQRTGDEVILNIRSPTGKEDKELKDSSSGMHPTAIISVIAVTVAGTVAMAHHGRAQFLSDFLDQLRRYFAGAEGGIGAPAGEGAGIQAFLMQISQLYISAYFNDVRFVLLLNNYGTQGIL